MIDSASICEVVPIKRWYIAERELNSYLYLVNPIDQRIHRLETGGKLLWDLFDGNANIQEINRKFIDRVNQIHITSLLEATVRFLINLEKYGLIYFSNEDSEVIDNWLRHSNGEGRDLFSLSKDPFGKQDELISEMWLYASYSRIILKSDLEITYACNQKCLHCYNASTRKKTLTTAQFLEVIDALAEQGCLFLGLTGGEIFARRDVMILARRAKQQKFSLRLLTNGTLISEEYADQIAELFPETVEISLYGTQPETHDYFTQTPGSFQKIIKSISMLAQRKVNTYIRFIFTRFNVEESLMLPELTKNLGVKYIYAKPYISPTVDGKLHPGRYRLSDDQYRFLRRHKIISTDERKKCYAGISRCCISPWGDVRPCEFLPHTFGNLKSQSLKEVWNKVPEKLIYEDSRVYDPPKCIGCVYRNTCSRCPAMSFLDDGSLIVPSSQACHISRLTDSNE